MSTPSVSTIPGSNAHQIDKTLRRAGLRPTRQRMALVRLLLAKGNRHITAEGLFREASSARIAVSLATVYNTLKNLTHAGLLRQVSVSGHATYFDTNVEPHHHYYIENGHELFDIVGEHPSLSRLPEVPDEFRIDRVDIVVKFRKIRPGKIAG